MTELSPAAQAVLGAFTGDDTIYGLHLMTPRLAAALRAAAPQMEFVQDHLKLLAIADELEDQ
jgi:hypothetical protein